MDSVIRRLAPLVVALVAGCAFPFDPDGTLDADGGTLDGGDCLSVCAGRCQGARCVPAGLGEPCDASGSGLACTAGLRCSSGTCVLGECADGDCSCLGAGACAGSCNGTACEPVPIGAACNASGLGQACVTGQCVRGFCEADPVRLPVALADYLTVARKNFCAYLVRCREWPARLLDQCSEAMFPSRATFDTDAESIAAVQRGEATYSAAEAGNCLNGLAFLACNENLPSACDRIFNGQRGVGSACTATTSCRSSLYCKQGDSFGVSCTGACVARPVAGESCDAAPCAGGLSCVLEGNESRCRVTIGPGAAGERCGNSFAECAAGLYCKPSTKLCTAKLGENVDCDRSDACQDGFTCAPASGATRCLRPRDLGDACTSNQQCAPLTERVNVMACTSGRCAFLPKTGPCVVDARLADTCDPRSAACGSDGRCHPFGAELDACEDSDACGDRLGDVRCVLGACRAPFACQGAP